MIHGNISNRKAPSMLFRVENFLVKYRETTTIDKVLNKIIGKERRAELNEEVCNALYMIFRATDFTVGIVCMQETWVKLPKELRDVLLVGLPIADIHLIDNVYDIRLLLNSGQYSYYVDDNLDDHKIVGENKCLALADLNNIAKKGYKYE